MTHNNLSFPLDPDATGLVLHLNLPHPSLQDNTADADRLRHAVQRQLKLDHIDMDLAVVKELSAVLRRNNYAVRCVVVKERGWGHILHVASQNSTRFLGGLAVDLGTTRVVVRLVDLDARQVLGERAFDNPQAVIGPDILARVHHADQPEGLAELNRLIIDALNREVGHLCASCGLSPDRIFLVTVAGNTTMGHLLAGLPVHGIIREPYIPAANRFGLMEAGRMGLRTHAQARLYLFPNAGSYFGGDLIAGILFCGLDRRTETAILVDVGTNAEVVLGNRDWLMACAGAAGPALESGVTRMGTTAGPGVIDRVRIDPVTGAFDLHTIGDLDPRGICGSGVIDLAAQLFLAGMLDIRGKLRPDRCAERLFVKDEMAHLIVVPADRSGTGGALTISQADLDSLIRSKAAMYTILETITGTMGMSLNDLETFFVAGTFGSFIDPSSAITLGMIPDLPLERYHSLGNSSLGGATLALTDLEILTMAESVHKRITYMELNVNQDFMNRFSAAKFLPHTDPARFPSVPKPTKAEV